MLAGGTLHVGQRPGAGAWSLGAGLEQVARRGWPCEEENRPCGIVLVQTRQQLGPCEQRGRASVQR